MATLNTQQVSPSGLSPVYSAAAVGGDKFQPDGRTSVHFKNGSGSVITVTIVTTDTGGGGQPEADVAVAVAAGGEAICGPFNPAAYADATGLCAMTYSGVTTLTVGVFRI